MCGSCVAKATPVLNEAIGAGNWKIDTQNPKKVLTVAREGLSEAEVVKAVEKAGFKAEALQ